MNYRIMSRAEVEAHQGLAKAMREVDRLNTLGLKRAAQAIRRLRPALDAAYKRMAVAAEEITQLRRRGHT